ncbi:inorganic pyrophosphatase [Thermotomaculum hydrothermale]|uniref:inorganic diphosphatase n=1 Tax=Thermotomaculum hydrothermale TaxID=981385 RepID=A0A7R6SYD9_9BACT|nr:inorganic pyrophosphatase [Thermotomaculum hydrothermale]BBB32669.1 inorganic pyrophosphatase [Thermotomaculum hydrothermale]
MSFPKMFHRFRPHPWHGLEAGKDAPRIVNAYIEITPFDSVKYELDKETGYIRVDRPQRTSSQPPALYGLIPRTYCGRRVAELSPTVKKADGDPLDICVISERPITRGEIILRAKVIGGIQMVDHGEADDKIIAVLEKDNIWGNAESIKDIPDIMVDRLRHYFATYKILPGENSAAVSVEFVYDFDHAEKVIKAAMEDYIEMYGE